MNIPVVEDEPEMASTLVRGLREEFLEVQLPHDGRRALQLSQDNSFDLIPLDVMLPDLSGFDVVRQLRQPTEDTPGADAHRARLASRHNRWTGFGRR